MQKQICDSRMKGKLHGLMNLSSLQILNYHEIF